MSTETAEPPVASVLDALSTMTIRAEGSPKPEQTPAPGTPETPTPETPQLSEPQKQPETPPEPPKPVEIPPELKGKARENFARLEQAKRDAEEKAAKIEKEHQEALKRLQEQDEKLKTFNPDDFQRQIEERDRKLQELQNEYKLVALEKDPEFINTYDRPRHLLQEGLKDMALQASVSEQDFHRALRLGDQVRLEEIRDSLPSHLQRRWDASLNQIEQISVQRDVALKDKENTYHQLAQQRQEQYRQQHNLRLQENLSLAERIAEEPFEKIESIRDNAELKARLKATLHGVAGGKGAEAWTPEKIMRQVAAAETLQHFMGVQNQVIEGQKGEMETLKKSLEERDTKIKELETFIQSRHGSLPNNEVTAGGGQKKVEADKPIWEQLIVQPR